MQNKTEQKRRKEKNKRKKNKKTTYSLPSLREWSETPGVLDRHDWESQEFTSCDSQSYTTPPYISLMWEDM